MFRVFVLSLAACSAFAIVGCAAPMRVTAVDVVARADADVVRAQHDLTARRVRIAGEVTDKFLRSHRTYEATGYANDVVVTARSEQLPVVVLGPAGRVHCYFQAKHLEEAAQLAVGQHVELSCSFDCYWSDSETGAPVAILGGCRLADR